MSNELNLGQHISKKYNEDLENLRESVLKMGGLVEKQLEDSIKSLVNGDVELARLVIKSDKPINQHELEIDKRAAELIATRQPTASDLRLLLCVVKIIADLERIGDLSQHLAKMGKKLADKGYSMRYFADIEHTGTQAKKMLTATLDAFARLDDEAAIVAMTYEQQINRESRALSRQLVTYMMEDPRTLKKTLKMFNAVRSLERIGDHCENISESILYLIRGEDVRYQGFDAVRETLERDDPDE